MNSTRLIVKTGDGSMASDKVKKFTDGNFDEVIAMPARKPRIPVVAV